MGNDMSAEQRTDRAPDLAPLDSLTLAVVRIAIAEIEGEGPRTVDDAFASINSRLNELIKEALNERRLMFECPGCGADLSVAVCKCCAVGASERIKP
jgi:hypothetical protein